MTPVMLDAMSLRLVLRRVPARDGVGLVALAVAALDGESVGGLVHGLGEAPPPQGGSEMPSAVEPPKLLAGPCDHRRGPAARQHAG